MRNIFTIFVALTLVITSASAQADSSNLCETRTPDIAAELAAMTTHFLPESEALLREWERVCDYSEPAERLRILMAIREGVFDPKAFLDYQSEGVRRFLSRVKEAESADFQSFYTENAAWFCYLPLNSAYDLHTREMAEQLLPRQKKGTHAYALCLMLAHRIDDFERERDNRTYKYTPLHPRLKQPKVVRPIHEDVLTRVASLGASFHDRSLGASQGPSVYFGWALDVRLKETWSFDLYFDSHVAVRPDSITVFVSDMRIRTKSHYQGTIGLGVSRRFVQKNPRNRFDIRGGAGYAWLDTPVEYVPDPILEPEATVTEVNIGAFELRLGSEYMLGTKRGRALGLAASYHLRPFSLDRRLLTPMSWNQMLLAVRWHF